MNPIIRLMGIIDLVLVALILFYTLFPAAWLSTAGAYLVLKGGVFALLGDVISFLDVGVGFYLVVLSFGLGSGIISVLAMLFLVQKGLASML